jgi:hypothetical protein
VKTYVFINPDGTSDPGVLVLILAATGIIYRSQVGGHYTENRQDEGYLIPVGSEADSLSLRGFFRDTFKNWPPATFDLSNEHRWTEERLQMLERLIADRHGGITLDRGRLDHLTEAWVPVRTEYGEGILLWENSD